mgnify:CR=1 FL=1
MNYEHAQQYLDDIPRFTKKNPMTNTEKFLRYMGDNIDGIAKERRNFAESEHVIHVAGTNGKGSVCAFLNGILTQAGYRVGMFTSPHLVTMTERFRINGECISEEMFVEIFLLVKQAVDAGVREQLFDHPTYFEFLTGMAFVLFAREQTD